MKAIRAGVGIVFLSAVCCAAAAAAETARRFDIPRMEKIVVDAKADDWSDGGFMVKALTYRVLGGVNPPRAANFDPSFRLAWNDAGLLLWITVRDDTAREYEKVESLWEMDSVGIFVAAGLGSNNMYQLQIAPGMDSEHKAFRHFFGDERAGLARPKKLTADIAAGKIDGGFQIEVMLPWENLGLEPVIGLEIALQIGFIDYDGRHRSYAEARWYPRSGVYKDTTRMHQVRLSLKPSQPVLALANVKYEKLLHPVLEVCGAPELAGSAVSVRQAEKVLAEGVLAARRGRAMAAIPLTMPPIGKTSEELIVNIAGRHLGPIKIPDASAHRAGGIMRSRILFDSFCFTGKEFPRCGFEHPGLAQGLLGPHVISVRYFDRNFDEVTTAERPGRYGAVVTIETPDRRFRRLRTLYCASTDDKPLQAYAGNVKMRAEIELPPQMGINPESIRQNAQLLEDYFQRRFQEGLVNDPDSAIILAGLSEAAAGEKTDVFNDLFARDRQWWVTFKRKFYDLEERYSKPITLPRPIDGPPARTIREGTLVEAGMKPDAAKNIDALLNDWAANSDEAFAVCIVRHGVIALHKAYGTRHGKPMTVTTPSNMASITKLLGGTIIMMGVDEGLLDLEAPLEKVHPAFSGVKVDAPLTIRLLCNHWSGLSGHWRDLPHDLEEVIASSYPYLKVNKRYEYNSVDIELAGKLLEAVSGEALPQFYKRHLIDPLGLKDTKVTRMGFGTQSIPMDMAKIAQMLLNGGAYGRQRFFSKETFEKMLPEKDRRGIGTAWLTGNGLSERTFGHPAASNATIRIDLQNDLVIIMCRNAAGENFSKYHDNFLQAVADGLAKQ